MGSTLLFYLKERPVTETVTGWGQEHGTRRSSEHQAAGGRRLAFRAAPGAGPPRRRRRRSAKSISSAVVNRPRPNRRLARARSSLDAHGPQDVARLGLSRRAGRAGADRHITHGHHQGLAFDARETQVEVPGEPPRRVAVQVEPVQPLGESREEAIPQPLNTLGLRLAFAPGDLGRQAQADDQRDGQGPAPQSALVPAAVEQRGPAGPAGRAGGRTTRRSPWGHRTYGRRG